MKKARKTPKKESELAKRYRKLKLGRSWAAQVGVNYRYFMVFKNRDFGIDGAYILDDFMRIMREL